MRGGAVAARRAHNPKVAGSSPAPATNLQTIALKAMVFALARRTLVHKNSKTGGFCMNRSPVLATCFIRPDL